VVVVIGIVVVVVVVFVVADFIDMVGVSEIIGGGCIKVVMVREVMRTQI